ncbi:MAG: hypothetical protein HFI24_06465 [Lachnospiraceae bacterium]|nr:hypothetical protein [Lachnospiraceae bacterium]MCI9383834.1 hypothetical protein [Lachnospiraceae bacterium]
MKGKRFWALSLSAVLAVSMLSGCIRPQVTEDMIPTVTDLGMSEEAAPVEEEVRVVGLSMNKSYMAELTRMDGDNTQAAAVDAKAIPVVLKATSMDKDLKVKIVNQKNDRVITGTVFEVTVTDSNKKTQSYKDEDKDGIIYIKNMTPGSCTVSLKSSGSYSAPGDIKAEVKANLEYKVVDVTDEIKKESEINVAKEDSNTTGNSDAGTSVVLTDTVEFVESTKTEIMKQKVDEYGTPMYEKIISEPAKHHKDDNGDGTCDRCGAKMECQHTYEDKIVESTCTTAGTKTPTCSKCGAAKTAEALPLKAHSYTNGVCTVCSAKDPNYQAPHVHDLKEVKPATCTEAGEKACSCGGASEAIPALGHDFVNGVCTRCKASDPNGTTTAPENPATPENPTTPDNPAGTDTTLNTTNDPASAEETTASILNHALRLVGAANGEKIVYDTTSAPIMEGTGTFKYTGWQTIDNATYFFDKDGNKVTGTQIIQGIQYNFGGEGIRSGTIGIDVSKYQKGINWQKVKNAGINFVIIRCGYRGYGSGVLVEDPMYASHISGAKAAGLRVGVYFFSQAINEAEAVEEASMAVKLANRYGINMPIAIDSEYAAGGRGRADGLSKADRTKITIAFCNTVANSGHTPMVYASKNWFSEHLSPSQFPGSYRIWVAQYASKCTYSGRYDIWQNTSKGQVDGISGNVDMNVSSI